MKWKFWKSDEPLALPPEIVREVPKYICPNCSIEVRDEYCSHCGTKTVEKVCKIGHPVHLGDNFCPKCGDELKWCTNKERKPIAKATITTLSYDIYNNPFKNAFGGQLGQSAMMGLWR